MTFKLPSTNFFSTNFDESGLSKAKPLTNQGVCQRFREPSTNFCTAMRMVLLGVLGVLGVLSLSRAVLSTQATTDSDADDVFLEELHGKLHLLLALQVGLLCFRLLRTRK